MEELSTNAKGELLEASSETHRGDTLGPTSAVGAIINEEGWGSDGGIVEEETKCRWAIDQRRRELDE